MPVCISEIQPVSLKTILLIHSYLSNCIDLHQLPPGHLPITSFCRSSPIFAGHSSILLFVLIFTNPCEAILRSVVTDSNQSCGEFLIISRIFRTIGSEAIYIAVIETEECCRSKPYREFLYRWRLHFFARFTCSRQNGPYRFPALWIR